tara:strand:- start:5926 stop:6120 length:195 start_codon:yes stop_codon:yes gene_type:complete
MDYPNQFCIFFGSFVLTGDQIAASALPINLGLGTNHPINTPNKKYPILFLFGQLFARLNCWLIA